MWSIGLAFVVAAIGGTVALVQPSAAPPQTSKPARTAASAPAAPPATPAPPAPIQAADYGARGDDTADDAAALSAALAAVQPGGRVVLSADRVYRIESPVVVPAGTIFDGMGSTIRPVGQAYVELAGGRVQNVRFDSRADGPLLGGETAARITASGSQVLTSTFLGNGFRNGIYLGGAAGADCDDVLIQGNRFSGTAYGILKQGAEGTDADRLRILDNDLSDVSRGDAIALNVGREVGVEIRGNRIAGVEAEGTLNTGFGISVAGGSYGGALDEQTRDFVIAGNRVSATSAAAIHVEAANSFAISDNTITGTSGNGIEVWGSADATVIDNSIGGFPGAGILNAMGYVTDYIVSTDRSLIKGNRIEGCGEGIHSVVAGPVAFTLEGNLITGCFSGITLKGASEATLVDNTIEGAATPLSIDYGAPDLASVNATAGRDLVLLRNRAVDANGRETAAATFSNLSYDSLEEEGNSFDVP